MLVFIHNKDGKQLMPCKHSKARKLLKEGKAKVIRITPFTIKLLSGSSNYVQTIIGGMDTGSKVIGVCAMSNGKVLYQSEVYLREDVSGKMQQRSMYRRTRRGNKTRYTAIPVLNKNTCERLLN